MVIAITLPGGFESNKRSGFVCMYVYTYVCMYVCTRKCASVYPVHVFMYVCCMCVGMCVYI